MAEVDYAQILLGFIGGSGLVGLVLTYFQLREERKEKARERLSSLVMTSELRRWIGSLGAQIETLPDGLRLVSKLLVARADHNGPAEEAALIKELLVWAKGTLQSLNETRSRHSRIVDNGDFFLMPTEWRHNADKLMRAIGDYSASCVEIHHLGKKISLLEADQFEVPNLPIAEELKEALHKAETALDNSRAALRALDLSVRKTLGLTILGE